jgi:hypothetical protein
MRVGNSRRVDLVGVLSMSTRAASHLKSICACETMAIVSGLSRSIDMKVPTNTDELTAESRWTGDARC